MDCYKIEIKAEDYPRKHIRAVPLSTGDVLYSIAIISERFAHFLNTKECVPNNIVI